MKLHWSIRLHCSFYSYIYEVNSIVCINTNILDRVVAYVVNESKHEKYSIVHWTTVQLQFKSINANSSMYRTRNLYLFLTVCRLFEMLPLNFESIEILLWANRQPKTPCNKHEKKNTNRTQSINISTKHKRCGKFTEIVLANIRHLWHGIVRNTREKKN